MDPHLTGEKQAPASNGPGVENIEPLEETKMKLAQSGRKGGILQSPKQEQASQNDNAAEDGAAEPEPPFSIFSRREKTFIVVMASLAALFSPLSANIYYPALNVLAKDLNVSNTLINLTVTSYLV